MKKIKITTVRECLADLLELPGDLAYHGCIITLIGEREILLENYRSILEYRSDHLLVLTGNGKIRMHDRQTIQSTFWLPYVGRL